MTPAEHADSRAHGDVHLWRIVLGNVDSKISDVLSLEERQRASRFHFDKDRREFAITRSILRRLLATYTGQRPEHLHFRRQERGKPMVDGGLQFNVSHAHGVAVIAISDLSVGVDVEYVVTDFPWGPIVTNFFSSKECAWIKALPDSYRTKGFFRCWTRREAYVKARGSGVPTEAACGLSPIMTDGNTWWSIQSFSPFSGYIGAIAAERAECRVRIFDWQLDTASVAA